MFLNLTCHTRVLDVQCLNLDEKLGFAVGTATAGNTYGSEREVTCLAGFDGSLTMIVCTGLPGTGGWAFKENDALAWDWSSCQKQFEANLIFDVATSATSPLPLALITAAVVLVWVA